MTRRPSRPAGAMRRAHGGERMAGMVTVEMAAQNLAAGWPTLAAAAALSGVFSAALGWAAHAWWARRAVSKGRLPDTEAVMASLDPLAQLDVFDHIVDSAGIGFYHWDMGGDEVLWSRHHRAIFAVGEGVLTTYATFRERVHPDDAADVDAAIAGAIADRRDYVCEYRIVLPDGRLRFIRGSGRISYGDDGTPLRMSGAVIDVSAATEARLATARRERELAAIIDNLPDVISRFDTQRRHLFVSPNIERITGMPPAAFIGKTNEDLGMDPVMCARWRALLEDVIRHGVVREFEFSYANPDGEEQFFVTRAIPTFGSDGKVESVMTIATDHTLRERAARRLRESEALLQQADLRKNEYLATLAHELRGPLAPIATAVQLMKLSERIDVWSKSRQVIERQVGQLVELVDDLMEIGRISAGKIALRLARTSLQSAVEHAIESVRPLIDGAAQQLTVHLPDGPVWLEADPTRLTQIFTNLLTNASKYSSAGGQIALTARIEPAADAGTYQVAIIISDDGIGLTLEAMTTIFDMFSQVHAQGEQARGGLGIGLSLVRHLVRLHHGEIGVSSAGIGQGAQFTVRLPLAAVQESAAHESAAHESAAHESAAADAVEAPLAVPAAARRVLVVDDSVDGAETLVELLEALGQEADCVHTGGAAIAAAQAQHYDLVLLDLGLPDISGIQVALHLRGKPWGRSLRLVALTGLGQQQDRDLTRAAGFDLHLVKPVRIEDLMALVAEDASASKGA
ncbi:MAG: ATP-binding protein [Massilia sp.]